MIDCSIRVPSSLCERADALLQTILPEGYALEDYSQLERDVEETTHMGLIDEALLEKDRDLATFHLYFEEEEKLKEALLKIEPLFSAEGIPYTVSRKTLCPEEYQTSWQKYYHPITIGKKLLICPFPEKEVNKQGKTVLYLKPGMAFGTGMHETTQLCLTLLETYLRPLDSVLDVGCGSGILAIASQLLGAGTVEGIDIDPLAVASAKENARLNRCSISFKKGDLLSGTQNTYNLVCANIVADAIIEMSHSLPGILKKKGRCICSGILSPRSQEVEAALKKAGLSVMDQLQKNDWIALYLEKG